MKNSLIKYTLPILLVLGSLGSVYAEASLVSTEKAEKKQFSHLGLEELTLKNGMKVLLKHTDFEDDEVSFKVTALGGFASAAEYDRASAELAPLVAWESGLGNYCCDKLSVMLWDNCVEADVRINPYSRVFEGTSRPEGVGTFLKVLNLYFTHPHFSQKGFDTVKSRAENSIKKRACDHDTAFEDIYKSLNTENFNALRPLSLRDLEQVNFATSKQFFERSFSNPGEFVVVIVGNYEKETIYKLIEQYLVTIPASDKSLATARFLQPSFPEGMTSRNIKAPTRKNCLTRMTFPVTVDMNEDKVFALDILTQVMETRLRRVIIERMDTSHALDVAYEFPMYPKISKPWISVQFTCEPEKKGVLRKLVIAELEKLQKEGPTQNEVDVVRSLVSKSDDFWLRDNDYWVALLSNYYSWGWDPTGIVKNYDSEPYLVVPNMKKIIQTYFSISNYTILSAKP